ncbi:hypothetical protein EV363DRAFT_1396040 [Boletus edulis]|nr:hypothetical protein EV363DRAFT_1396040 [Boletus edulis]
MGTPATPPSHSGIPPADQLSSLPSTTFKSIFGVPASSHHPHSSSSTPSMGQVASRPQVTTSLSPSSAPSSLGITASSTGGRFKRALVGRRKKSDVVVPPSPRPDKGKEPQIDESLHAAPRPLGAKQLTLQLAQHVFNKKSAPASPAMSGLSLPPPPPPPKHADQPAPPSSRLTPINTNIDRRISVITTSSPIVPALDYMKKSDEPTERVASKENERRDVERLESKDVRRKSDSTLSLHTIRPTLGSRTPRPVSITDSLQSAHTIVPINKRLSALITDAEYVMAEEEDDSRNDEKRRSLGRPSPAPSLRIRDRRSQSLNLGPPLSLMLSSSTVSNATMSLETITVTLPRSASEGCERERLAREMATVTFSSLPSATAQEAVTRHSRAVSSLNQAVQPVTLQDLPPQTPPPPQSPQPSFRQTAISMTSGFAPAAGLARRAVERMGRVWGSKNSFSSPFVSPLGEPSSNGGSPSRTNSSHSESVYHGHGRRIRHNPQTPSVSSTASSLSDHEGPQLGRRLRGPVGVSGVGGLVFGRELKTCVEETAIDPFLSVLRAQNVWQDGREESDTSERVQWSQPSAPLESRHLPALVVRCAQHILAWGVQEQGLFRVSGRSSHIAKLRAEFDTGADFDIVQSNPGDLDPHAVASVFKAYLRELPEPILTNHLMPYFDAAVASERLANNIQDPPLSSNFHGLRKPPSLSTLGMPKFSATHPPSESLRKTLSTLISCLPQENRDLLFTVTEIINHTAKRSSETKMPLSNLLLVLCPSLSMNPPLLQALCESQGIWHGVHQCKDGLDLDAIAAGADQSNLGFSENGAEIRFVGPLPSLPTTDGTTSVSSSSSTCEPLGLGVSGHDAISQSPPDTETPSPSFSTTDDSSSISHLSQGGRPVTPTSLNFKLTNPYSPPSLSCSTDSLSVPSLSSGSPMQLVKSLTLVDECSEQQSSNYPEIAEPIPLPIPSSRLAQNPAETQIQFPGPRDSVVRNPIMHRKSTPSISFSSSISAEARSASIASRTKRLKKPSLHLLFSKNSPSPVPLPKPETPPVVASPFGTSQEVDLWSSSTSGSSPDSMVTAPQSSRFSYPPVLNTAIDESSISLALGIQGDGQDHAIPVGHATKNGMTNSQGSIGPGTALCHIPPEECSKDVQFRRLNVTLPEEEQFGEYNWTQSVLMAAGEPRW